MSKPIMTVQYIQLAGDEWGNRLMDEIAEAYFASYMDDPYKLLLEVYEHGGWWLRYAMIDGQVRIVHSANDCAKWEDDVKAFWKMYSSCEAKRLPAVRRQSTKLIGPAN